MILLSIFQQNVIKEAIYQIRTYFNLPKVINNNAWSSAWIINGVGAAIQDIERQDQKKWEKKGAWSKYRHLQFFRKNIFQQYFLRI